MNVRISGELQSDVRSHINSMRLKDLQLQLGSSEQDKLFCISGSSTELLNLVWGKHLHLKSQMPTEWMKDLCKEYRPHIWIRVQWDQLTTEPKSKKFQVYVLHGGSFLVPPRMQSGSEFSVRKEDLTGDLKRINDLNDQWDELCAKWTKISSDVITYLKSAKSLNSALKNWPELKAFIPQEYLDRVATKPERTAERKKAEEALANIDRNLAVTSATMVKLATT
jgi:hypothetical protein